MGASRGARHRGRKSRGCSFISLWTSRLFLKGKELNHFIPTLNHITTILANRIKTRQTKQENPSLSTAWPSRSAHATRLMSQIDRFVCRGYKELRLGSLLIVFVEQGPRGSHLKGFVYAFCRLCRCFKMWEWLRPHDCCTRCRAAPV
jgi:hypothetical protein